MTSKNSFTRMVARNIRGRGVWLLVSFLAFFFALPVKTLMRFDQIVNNMNAHPRLLEVEIKEMFLSIVGYGNVTLIPIVAISAFAMAISGFCYLYSGEKTDFYHSLPVRREKLFGVSYLGGLFIFFIPYVLNVIFAMIVGVVHGVKISGSMGSIAGAFLVHVVFYLVFYELAILAVMLTGNIVTGVMGYAAFMSYTILVSGMFTSLSNRFLDTYVSETSFRIFMFHPQSASRLFPLGGYLNILNQGINSGKIPLGGLLAGAVEAILVLAVVVFVYKKRPSEGYHKAIAFKKLEKIIKVGVVIPLSVLIALAFSSNTGGNTFLWFMASLVFTGILLCLAMEFLYSMDLRESFRLRITTGIILAVLVGMSVIYRFDLFGIDTYLPKEEKVESMSAYIYGINDRYDYPGVMSYYKYDFMNYLKNVNIKDFHDIYELAEMGVEIQKQNIDKKELQNEDTLSYCIKYKLKSGKTVYKNYIIPKNEAAVAQIGKIYDNWEFKENTLTVEFVDGKEISQMFVSDIYTNERTVNVSQESREKIFKTYKNEWESFKFKDIMEQQVIGFLRAESETEVNGRKQFYSVNMPIYEGFTNTMKLLEESGCKVYGAKDASEIQEVIVTVYPSEGEARTYTYEEEEKIKDILKATVFEQFSGDMNDTYPDYNKSVRIIWKDGIGESQSMLYLAKGKYPSFLEKDMNNDN